MGYNTWVCTQSAENNVQINEDSYDCNPSSPSNHCNSNWRTFNKSLNIKRHLKKYFYSKNYFFAACHSLSYFNFFFRSSPQEYSSLYSPCFRSTAKPPALCQGGKNGGIAKAHYHQTLSAILCLISARESRRHSTQTIMVATGTGVGIRPSFVSFVRCHRFSSLHLLHFKCSVQFLECFFLKDSFYFIFFQNLKHLGIFFHRYFSILRNFADIKRCQIIGSQLKLSLFIRYECAVLFLPWNKSVRDWNDFCRSPENCS